MGALLGFLAGAGLFHLWRFFPVTSILLSSVLIFLFIYKKRAAAIFPVLFLLTGFFYADFRYEPPPRFEGGGKLIVTGYPGLSHDGRNGPIQRIHIKEAKDETGRLYPLNEINIDDASPLEPGHEYTLLLKIKPPHIRLNPGGPFQKRFSAQLLTVLGKSPGSVIERIRGRLNQFYAAHFEQDNAGFIASVITGERALLDQRLWDSFNNAGVGHLLSISGAHFGIFSVCVFFVLRQLFGLLPLKWLERMSLHVTPAQAGAALTLPFITGYLLLSGMEVPAVRSFVMISLFLVGLLIGRRRAWLAGLLFSAVIIVLADPSAILDVPFQLSFFSVFFIGAFTSNIKNMQKGRLGKYVLGSLMVSLSAILGILPLTAFYFHKASLVSPASNLIMVPFAGFVLVPLYLASSVIYLISGHFPLIWLSGWLTGIFLKTAGLFSDLPFSHIRLAAFPPGLLFLSYPFLVLFSLRRKTVFAALAVLPFALFIALSFFKTPSLKVAFLDAGEGDASVVSLPDGKVLAVDTGPTGVEEASYLDYTGTGKIDALALSHPHSDHTAGAGCLLDRFKVGEIWDNSDFSYSGKLFDGVPRKSLSRGDTLAGKGYRITVLHPYKGFDGGGNDNSRTNDRSLVLKIEDGQGRGVLFTGDIGERAEEDLIRAEDISGLNFLGCYCLKVPHHGSSHSVSLEFIRRAHPGLAVITAGAGNVFGFPRPETLAELSGIRVLRPDLEGTILLDFKRNGVEVSRYSDLILRERPGLEGELHNLRYLFSVLR